LLLRLSLGNLLHLLSYFLEPVGLSGHLLIVHLLHEPPVLLLKLIIQVISNYLTIVGGFPVAFGI
jgi:hypothetical protein